MEIKNNELKGFWDNKFEEKEIKKNENRRTNNEKNINFNNDNLSYYSKKEDNSFFPKFFIVQIILNTILFFLSVGLNEGFIIIMILNCVLFWLYSFISILKNDFKKENDKYLWIFILIFVPIITPFLYPDFKEKITK